MSEIGIGIVGLGWVAGAHIEAFRSVRGASVRAICSRRKHDPADLESTYGIPLKAYTDYEAMLADPDIDVIDICTPHPLHPAQAIAAAQANKHLIIEKPVALKYEDLNAVRDAIRTAGVQAAVCFECRFSAHFTLIRSVLDQGLLGSIHYGEADYYHGVGPWYGQFEWNVKKDIGGSSLLTGGCHALDALLMFMGDEVEEVMCYQTKSSHEAFAPYEYPTTSTSLLRFADGRVGKVASVIDCMQPYYFHVQLVGSQGSLLDNKIYTEQLPGLSKSWTALQTSLVDSGDVSDHPYTEQFQVFADSLAKGEPMPLTDFETAYQTHRVIFAAERSAELGRPIKLAELDAG